MSNAYKTYEQFVNDRASVTALTGSEKLVISQSGVSKDVTPDRLSDYAIAEFNGVVVYDARQYGVLADGSTDDTTAIQTGINAVNAAGGGTLELPAGTIYTINRIVPKSNVRVRGKGMGTTTLFGGNDTDYTFLNTSALDNFWLEDLTIDCNDAFRSSGVRYYAATNSGCRRVEFKNVPSNGWMFKLGVSDGVNDGILNDNNVLEDCIFDTHAGTLEMLLLFNCSNTKIIRPYFTNKTTGGPLLGLWQKTYNTRIIDPVFKDTLGTCIYYSITCHETYITRPYFENASTGIAGANVSDNGVFSESQAVGLYVDSPVFIGGANSTSSTAFQFGAVDRLEVKNPVVSGAAVGIRINEGNSASHPYQVTNWVIENPISFNNNPSNNNFPIHPGIFFSGIGGSMNGKLVNGNVYDDQVTKTQRYPLVFDGAFTWSDLQVVNTRLNADTANSGVPILLSNSAVLATSVSVKNCPGLNPDTPYVQGNVTGATIFNRVNGATLYCTQTGDVTATLTAGVIHGDRLTRIFTMGGAGSYTYTKGSNEKLVGGAYAPTAAVGSIDILEQEWDGTNWVEIGRSLNLS